MMASLTMLALAMAAPSASPPPDEADIVVLARRMRTVRLNYALFGSHLKSCTPEISSGDARIDRIMCAVLRQCVESGATEPLPARACINDRIALLEQAPALAPQPQPMAEPMAEPVTQRAIASQLAQPPAAPAPKLEEEDHLVVTAQPLPMTAGEWLFSQRTTITGTIRGAVMPAPASWRACIAPGAMLAALEQMIDPPETPSAPSFCRQWNITLRDGQISGAMRCMRPGIRLTGTVEGSITPEQVSFVKKRLQKRLNPIRGIVPSADDQEMTEQLSGRRTGTCKG